MIKYFYYGATDLFHGTALFQENFMRGEFRWCPSDASKHNFPPCPVIHLDFSAVFGDAASFENQLIEDLREIGRSEGAGDIVGSTVGKVLKSLIIKLANQRLNEWQKVVILIDEYDSPLNKMLSANIDFAGMLEVYKEFFSTIKCMDHCIEFAYVTGITSYGLAGLFSGANNFVDKTFDYRYHSLFGFTKSEVVQVITDVRGMPPNEATLKALEAKYNGYSWIVTEQEPHETVYNPFSIAQYCNTGILGSFWTQTSSQSLMKTFPVVSTVRFPLIMPGNSLTLPRSPMVLINKVSDESVGRLLLEMGYATIKSVSASNLTLDYPNEEIRDYIKSDFLAFFFQTSPCSFAFDAVKMSVLGGDGNVTALISYINQGIQSVSYVYASMLQKEAFWVLHTRLALWCMNAEFSSETTNLNGRSDMLLFIGNTQYILEFKVVDANGNKKRLTKVAHEALEQVERNSYEENDLARNKKAAGALKQTVKIVIVVDTHKTMRKIALMISKTPDGKLTDKYFE